MIRRIRSNLEPGRLLHLAYSHGDELPLPRFNLCEDQEFIQVAHLHMYEMQTFRPHRHIPSARVQPDYIPQETWIVVRGRVRVTYYDTDGTLLAQHDLETGDCTVTFAGGHTYTCLQDDTLVYEVKTGPYEGQEKDKVFL